MSVCGRREDGGGVCVCVCVCVRERERERENVFVLKTLPMAYKIIATLF